MRYAWNVDIPEKGKYDVMSLGALIHRLDSGDIPTKYARQFTVHVSGAEYNLAANTKRYGLNTAVLTGMADYCIGDMIRTHVADVGVDIVGPTFPHTPWDGNHATVYSYTPNGCFPNQIDYTRSAETGVKIEPGTLDYDEIFDGGIKWVHSGGLYAALAEQSTDLIIEFFQEAKKRGAVVSFDLNYRGKLWASHGGQKKAIESMTEIVKNVDVLFGNETDAQNALGISASVKGEDKLDIRPFEDVQEKVRAKFPQLKIIVTSLRNELSNVRHMWGAVASVGGEIYSVPAAEISVLCRIGGGDGLASGFTKAIFEGLTPEEAIYAGWASGALVASVRGDITQANWDQVQFVADGYRTGKTQKVMR